MTVVRENVFLVVAMLVLAILMTLKMPVQAQEQAAVLFDASLGPSGETDLGTVLVGMVGTLGEAEGLVAGLTVEAMDAECGAAAWEVWYELGADGAVIPASVEAMCQAADAG
jgi:hypothetical protein